MVVSVPIIILLCLFAYRAPSLAGAGVTDPDYYWHVGYGEWILAHGQLPESDFWSWTFNGHPYRLTQWLGEVCMGLANNSAGHLGTSTLAALLVTLTMAASYRAARVFLDNRLAAITVALVCNSTLISLACRPHQFTHLGLALLTWIIASYQAGNRKALHWLPPLFALWVNVHGGYAFGLTYLGMVATFVAIEAYIQRDAAGLRSLAMPLFVGTGVALAATLLNPYGWGAWQYAIEIASLKSSAAGVVDEWAATSIKTEAGLSFFLVTSAVIGAMALTSKQLKLSQVLMAIALMALGWSAVRLSVMASILMVPLLAASLRSTPFFALAFDGEARKYDRTYSAGVAVSAFLLVLSASYGLSRIDKTTERAMATKLPVTETAFIKEHGLNGKIFNPPEAGGYLIHHLGTKVSMDTRYDLYGDRAFFEMLFAQRGDAGWQEYLTRLDPDVVLLNNPSPLRHLLASGGDYRPVFEGPAYTVLVRKGSYPELPTVPLVPANQAIFDQLKS